jgi:CD2 antigen cytoplasmic tail-binding protein 2
MSFSNRNHDRGGNHKSVRFAAANGNDASAAENDARFHLHPDPPANDGPRRRKKPRLERPNVDEEDDIDDWNDEEEEEEEDDLPISAKKLLNAKRQRREHDFDDEDDTRVDEQTSLLASQENDDIPIEPFNMNAEQTDGSGYFDGDTYVFRKHHAEEEPDAWLESLSDGKQGQQVASIPETTTMDAETNGINDLSKEDLVSKIVPLISEDESVLQAVVRFGNLLKRNKRNSTNEDNVTCVQTAQKALNDLTEAANALMLKGNVDIYQQTRNELLKLLADSKPPSTNKEKQHVSWEYRGNQDGQIHGPYATQQMLAWIQAGYFIGEQAVQIRTIAKAAPPESMSTADDLLSDLMEDDEQEDKQVKGEWTSSNDIDFSMYE